ncbi:MAG: DMT family transporter [Verrucomicrobiales bacterium]|nr:DMT family transporter [Verrucomicrobiales bacterium]
MKTQTPDLTTLPAATIRRGIIVMSISVSAFTVNTLLLRYLSGASRGIPPEVPLLFRAAVGMLIVLLFFRGRRPTRIKPVFTQRLLILRGITGLLGTAAYYWTVPQLGAGMATLICNTYVIFASIIAVLALGEKLTKTRFAWLAAAFVGIVLLIGPNAEVEGFSFGVYEWIALAGAILAAWSVVLVRRLVADHSIGTIYLAQCVWIFLPLVFVAGPLLPDLEPNDWALLIAAAVAAGFGQLSMNEGYRCLSVSNGASMQMLWPVATTFGGWILFEEYLIPLQIVGAILILASILRMSGSKA